MKVKFADRPTAKNGVVQQRVTHIVRRSDDGAMRCTSGSPNEHGAECPAVAAVAEFIAAHQPEWSLLWAERAEDGVTMAILGSPNEWVEVRRSVL
jgi:hypothetical protein